MKTKGDGMNDSTVVSPGIDAKAAIWAAIVAGIAFMMLEMVMVAVFKGQSPWGPPRMIAAIGMGKGVLPPPATFDVGILMVAMLIHFGTSLLLAFVFAFIVRVRTVGMSTMVGAAFGLAVYLVNFYGMTAVFPWFAMARGWITIFTHIMFGAVLGLVYASVAHRDVVRRGA